MIKIKLKPRLLAIADLIEEGSNVIDVGADHALLDIYLNLEKNCTCLAIDKSKACTIKAEENAKKYGADIDIIQNDGLQGITLSNEIIVISGVGTDTIKKILNFEIKNDLIIITHTKLDELKTFLTEKNYKIEIEKEIYDKRYYTLIYAKTTT